MGVSYDATRQTSAGSPSRATSGVRMALLVEKLTAPAVPVEVQIAYARVTPRMREIQTQACALEASGVHRLLELCGPDCGPRVPFAKGTLVVHEMKRPGRGALELLKAAEGDRPRKGRTIGGVKVSDEDILTTALRLRDDERLSPREIASCLVIRSEKRGRAPAPATVMRMLRGHSNGQPQPLDTGPASPWSRLRRKDCTAGHRSADGYDEPPH